jgi:hypothetical protein
MTSFTLQRVYFQEPELNTTTDEVRQLFIGQSYDLLWTSELSNPPISQYFQMVDGSMFFPPTITDTVVRVY